MADTIAHCWDCLREIKTGETYTVDKFGQANCSTCLPVPSTDHWLLRQRPKKR